MKSILPWLLVAACTLPVGAHAGAAGPVSPSGGVAAPSSGTPPGNAATPQRKPSDPLGNLKPYEERRYRIDMQDCGKEKGVDRRLCERSVQRKAATKSRRRAASGR